jgi:pilus assembly protein CpaB
MLRQAMNRPMDGGTTFVTGGDVSRFQRKSKPATGEEKAAQAAAMMTQAITAAAAASGMPSGGQQMARIPSGPVVRVTRGKLTMDVPVGRDQ